MTRTAAVYVARPLVLLILALAGAFPAEQLPLLARDALAAHNAVRAKFGVPPLVWSDPLAKSAQQWANTLLATGGFSHNGSGQNIGEFSPPGSQTADDTINAWAAEVNNYRHDTNTCSARCGHYTQVAWRDTRVLGCAVAWNASREILVCNYDPPGNVVGERPY